MRSYLWAGIAAVAASFPPCLVTAGELGDSSVEDVQQLLVQWNLENVFGDLFQRMQVDGDILTNDLKPQHIDLSACPDATAAHVSKLFRKVKALSATAAGQAEQLQQRHAVAAAPARRRLAGSSDNRAGLSIARDNGMIAMGAESDVMIVRTADGRLGMSPHVVVEGTVDVPSIDSVTVSAPHLNSSYFEATYDTHVFVGEEPIKLGRSVAVTEAFTTGADYELSFDINPQGTHSDWSNIIHLTETRDNCCDYGSRVPAIWFYADTTRLLFVAGDNSTGNAHFNPLQELPIGSWTHIRLRVKGDEGKIFYNGTYVGSVATEARLPHDDTQVWLADPWYQPADAMVRNVMYQRLAYHHAGFYNNFTRHDVADSMEDRVEYLEAAAEATEETLGTLNTSYWDRVVAAVPEAEKNWQVFLGPDAVDLHKNRPVAGNFQTGAEYELTLDLYPYGTPYSDWNNIIHFTANGENCCEYGERIPAIWFYADSTRLHVIAGSNSSGNAGFHPIVQLPTNAWTTVRLMLVNDTGLIYYNDTFMGTIESDIRMPHSNVQVWLGDPWNGSPSAKARNVKYRIISYHHAHFYDSATDHDVESILNPNYLSVA